MTPISKAARYVLSTRRRDKTATNYKKENHLMSELTIQNTETAHNGTKVTNYHPVRLGNAVYDTHSISSDHNSHSTETMFLTGPRGALYILQPVHGRDSLYVAQSLTGGTLTRRGHRVIIRWEGSTIEQV